MHCLLAFGRGGYLVEHEIEKQSGIQHFVRLRYDRALGYAHHDGLN